MKTPTIAQAARRVQLEDFFNTTTSANPLEEFVDILTAENIAKSTMTELLAFFNANTGGNPVKKFADRKTAERRVLTLIAEMKAEEEIECLGIKDGKQAAHIIAEKIAAGANGTSATDFAVNVETFDNGKPVPAEAPIGKSNQQPATVRPDDACPKCDAVHDITSGRVVQRFGKQEVVDNDWFTCHGCGHEWGTRDSGSTKPVKTVGPRPAMQASLKLDRRIKNVKTGETWKNAYQMWKANPEWLTSAQVDRLTGTLYSAAKNGYQVTITINDRDFSLVQVAV